MQDSTPLPRRILLPLLAALALGPACGDDAPAETGATTGAATTGAATTAGTAASASAGTTAAACPGPGFVGCPCTDDGKCLEGLKCLASIDTCIDPADLTAGASTAGGETAGDSTTGEPCPDGLDGCPCLDGGLCIVGLECVFGTCEPTFDPTDSGGDLCVDDYEPCDSQFNCCDLGQHCLDFTNTNGDGVICAPECTTHTECPSRCCGAIQDSVISVCYSAPCAALCINTCEYAYDGECDDGGPGSAFALCEYGTDCFDCGNRDAADAPW